VYLQIAVEHLYMWLSVQETWRGEIVQLSWAPRAYLLKGFLSPEECQHLISLSRPSMQKSTVADNETGENIPSTFRTSTGTFLDHHQTSVVARIEARIAQVCAAAVYQCSAKCVR
jgi:prolyl 4-hydroxylase